MALFSFTVSVLLISMTFISCDESPCEDFPLTPFGEAVTKILQSSPENKEVFAKDFAVNVKNKDDIAAAVNKATDRLNLILGVNIDKSLVDKIGTQIKELSVKADSTCLYKLVTTVISQSLKDEGVLKDNNVDYLAQKYVHQLRKAAKPLELGDDIIKTFPAVTAANARFFACLCLDSNKFANKFYGCISDYYTMIDEETCT